MPTLSFREEYDYAADADRGISVPITLRLGAREAILIPRLDTGAQNCIFNRIYGEALELNIGDGQQQPFRTANGGQIVTFGHTVTIECLGWQVEAMVYFAEDEHFTKNVLGRTGWIDRFRLGVIHYDAKLYLSNYDDP